MREVAHLPLWHCATSLLFIIRVSFFLVVIVLSILEPILTEEELLAVSFPPHIVLGSRRSLLLFPPSLSLMIWIPFSYFQIQNSKIWNIRLQSIRLFESSLLLSYFFYQFNHLTLVEVGVKTHLQKVCPVYFLFFFILLYSVRLNPLFSVF